MATRQQKSTLAGQLTAAGFTFPFRVDDLLDQALRTGVSDPFSFFVAKVLASRRFRRHYRGIFRPNGTLKMNPAEYEAYVDSAKSAARSAGFSLSRRQVGIMIRKNKSAGEVASLIKVGRTVQAYRQLIPAINEVLRNKKMKPLRNAEQVFDFFAGRADRRVYDVYERAGIAAAAEATGLDLSRRRAKQLARRTADVEDFEGALTKFEALAEAKQLASAELRAAGISDKDLQDVEFGIGQDLGVRRATVERILTQRQTALQSDVPGQRLVLEEGRPVVEGQENLQ